MQFIGGGRGEEPPMERAAAAGGATAPEQADMADDEFPFKFHPPRTWMARKLLLLSRGFPFMEDRGFSIDHCKSSGI